MPDIDFTTNAKQVKKEIDGMRKSLKQAAREVDKAERNNKQFARTENKAKRAIDQTNKTRQRSIRTTKAYTAAEKQSSRAIDKTTRELKQQNRELDKNRLKKQQAAAKSKQQSSQSLKSKGSALSGLGAATGGSTGGVMGQLGGAVGMGAENSLLGVGAIGLAVGAFAINKIGEYIDASRNRSIERLQRGFSITRARRSGLEAIEQTRADSFKNSVQTQRRAQLLGLSNIIRGDLQVNEEKDLNINNVASKFGVSGFEAQNAIVGLGETFKGENLQKAIEALKFLGKGGEDLGSALASVSKFRGQDPKEWAAQILAKNTGLPLDTVREALSDTSTKGSKWAYLNLVDRNAAFASREERQIALSGMVGPGRQFPFSGSPKSKSESNIKSLKTGRPDMSEIKMVLMEELEIAQKKYELMNTWWDSVMNPQERYNLNQQILGITQDLNSIE